jgi:tetratricopeptide (TPR) repeat protein
MQKMKPKNIIVIFRPGFLLLTAVSLLSILISVRAQEPETLFDEANRAYSEGEYQRAIDLYQVILNRDLMSGEVYFNLGNAYFKQNQIGRSILYYEKARRFLEGDPALEYNLRLVRLRIVDEIEEIPMLFLESWWLELIQIFPINTILWLCLGLFAVLILLLILRLILNTRGFRNLIWIFFGLFLLVIIIAAGNIYEFETSQFGIILDEKVSVISEPGLGGKEVFILHEGTKVKVNRQLDDWLEITIPDGKTGWLKLSGLEII